MMKILDILMLMLEAFMLICVLHLLAAILDTKVVELLPGIVCYLWAYMVRSKQ